jgi:AcrR family transcriptional regulator
MPPTTEHPLPDVPAFPLIPRTGGDRRQSELVRAAFDIIAERGLEGLRTREVAARAGVNVAMVHYYFAGKASLIGGVVWYMVEQFMRSGAPAVVASAPGPLDRLRQEFADARYYRDALPKLGIVYQELFLRARRDPTILPMIQSLEDYWYDDIRRALADGVQEGVFRCDLDVDLATGMIVTMLRGALLVTIKEFDINAALAEVEAWLRPR